MKVELSSGGKSIAGGLVSGDIFTYSNYDGKVLGPMMVITGEYVKTAPNFNVAFVDMNGAVSCLRPNVAVEYLGRLLVSE